MGRALGDAVENFERNSARIVLRRRLAPTFARSASYGGQAVA